MLGPCAVVFVELRCLEPVTDAKKAVSATETTSPRSSTRCASAPLTVVFVPVGAGGFGLSDGLGCVPIVEPGKTVGPRKVLVVVIVMSESEDCTAGTTMTGLGRAMLEADARAVGG